MPSMKKAIGQEEPEPKQSAYRLAKARYSDPDDLWEYLRDNRFEDSTLMIGYAVLKAEREKGLEQQEIAALTGLYDEFGRVVDKPVTKGHITTVLSGSSKPSPNLYRRLAEICDIPVIDFFLAERWIDEASFAASTFDITEERQLALPILHRIVRLPEHKREAAKDAVLKMLDLIIISNDDKTSESGSSA